MRTHARSPTHTEVFRHTNRHSLTLNRLRTRFELELLGHRHCHRSNWCKHAHTRVHTHTHTHTHALLIGRGRRQAVWAHSPISPHTHITIANVFRPSGQHPCYCNRGTNKATRKGRSSPTPPTRNTSAHLWCGHEQQLLHRGPPQQRVEGALHGSERLVVHMVQGLCGNVGGRESRELAATRCRA